MKAADILCLVLPLVVNAASVPRYGGDFTGDQSRRSGSWHHEPSHPVHKLFRRQTTDGQTYSSVGSPAWTAAYPSSTADVGNVPQAWTDALNTAVSAGKIPDIPVSQGSSSKYPSGHDPNGPEVCSSAYQCRVPGDVWDGPDGVFWSSFDDGPQPASDTLADFLAQNNETTTHFLIGENIIQYPELFQKEFNAGDDIACHTWTHPYMTNLNNTLVLGELGWTLQLIHDSTGGRIPKYWRPPYGDADNRVRAIAREVFGLTTVIWNQDTNDWMIEKGSITPITTKLQGWLKGTKSPGLIILEHELYNTTVSAFMQSYPLIQQNGWQFKSLARIAEGNGTGPYQNSAGKDSPVTPANITDKSNVSVSSVTAAVVATSASASPSSSSGASGASTNAASISVEYSGFIFWTMILLALLQASWMN